MFVLCRRSVLKLAGASLGGSALATGTSASPRTGGAMLPVRRADVDLLEGPMLDQFRAHHATLLAMDEDALLKPFRQAAGLPAPGDDLGGWYNASAGFDPPADMHGFIPGHSFGQYVSSLARAYAATGNGATKQKAERLVSGFAPTITERFFRDYPLPAYTFDKINIGLIDAHEFAGATDALAVLDRATDAALPHLPEKALTRPEMAARPHRNVAYTWDESYTLPENLYLAWQRGAGERYRTLARRFLLDGDYFEPLSRGENVLPGRHAYSHVNALSSAMQAWLVDGDPKHLQAARNGFDFVLAQSFATGGWGPNEGFVVPGSGALGEVVEHDARELRDAVRRLWPFQDHPPSAGGDRRQPLRRQHGARSLQRRARRAADEARRDGLLLRRLQWRRRQDLFRIQMPVLLGNARPDRGGLWHQHLSRERPRHFCQPLCAVAAALARRHHHANDRLSARFARRYRGRYENTGSFSIALRIPAWAGAGTAVEVNGRRVREPVLPGTFHEIRRAWRGGDRVALTLDRKPRLEAVDEKHPDLLAVMQGPLALFAVGDRFLPLKRADLMSVRQAIEGSSDWRVSTRDGTQTFKPYFAIAGETTRLYQNTA